MVIEMKKINSLQGLRAIAFLAIFISHARLKNFGALGAWGVSVFFVLSGFLMIYNYLPKQIITKSAICFSWSKIKKLYPLHIFMMLSVAIPLLMKVFSGEESLKKWTIDILLHAFLIQIWVPNSEYYATLNGPSWFLSACVFLYFCFPTILKRFRNQKNNNVYIAMVWFVLGQLAFSGIAFLFGNRESAVFTMQWITYYFPLARLMDFLIGCCLGYLFLNKEECEQNDFLKNSVQEIILLILIAISFLIYWKRYSILGQEYLRYTVLFTLTTIPLIWLVACGKGLFSKVIEKPFWVRIGNISAYTFLIHEVVIRYCTAIMNKLIDNPNEYIIATISLVMTFVAAKVWKELQQTVVRCKQKASM